MLVCLFFTLEGAWLISRGDNIGWFASILFGLGCIVFILLLIPNSAYLQISEKGFEVRSLFRNHFTPWEDVEEFGSGYIGRNKLVIFNYSQNHNKYSLVKKIGRSISGVEGALPDTYGKSAEELAELLNEWRDKFLAEKEKRNKYSSSSKR